MDLENKLEELTKDIVDCEILLRNLDKKSKILTLNIDTSIVAFKNNNKTE